jgi:hypothetical protein
LEVSNEKARQLGQSVPNSPFEQGESVGGASFVALDIGAHIGCRQQMRVDARSIQSSRPVVGRTAGFHDNQRNVPILELALEQATGQAMLFNKLPGVIGDGNLEYTLGQITCNGSSMHFGLLSLNTDPHSREYRWRLLGAEKTGESIPSLQPTSALSRLLG